MIELRFVERSEEMQGAGEAPWSKRVRVLQYRNLFYPFNAASGDIGWYSSGADPEWTDVPLVVLP